MKKWLLLCCLIFAGCSSPELHEDWAREKFAENYFSIQEFDAFLTAEFEQMHPLSEEMRKQEMYADMGDSLTGIAYYDSLMFEMNLTLLSMESIEKEQRRQRKFENNVSLYLEHSPFRYYVLYYKFENEEAGNLRQGFTGLSARAGIKNGFIQPEAGFQMEDYQVGWGFFQDEAADFKYEPGIQVQWEVPQKGVTLYVWVIIPCEKPEKKKGFTFFESE